MKKLIIVSMIFSGSLLVGCPAKIINDTRYNIAIVDKSPYKRPRDTTKNLICSGGQWEMGDGDTHPHFTFTLKGEDPLCPKARGDIADISPEAMNSIYEAEQLSCTGGLVHFKISELIAAADQDATQVQRALPDKAEEHYVVTKCPLSDPGCYVPKRMSKESHHNHAH